MNFTTAIRPLFVLVTYFCLVTSSSAQEIKKSTQAEVDSMIRIYVADNVRLAVKEMHRTGIPASITLAQAICESGYGRSKTAQTAKNHFGIKCYESWGGKKYFHVDDEKNKKGELIPSCFRAYDSIAQSYFDHSEFIMMRPWYEPLFNLNSDDHKGWAKGLEKAGYANVTDYSGRLFKYINKFELHQYDVPNLPLGRRKTTMKELVQRAKKFKEKKSINKSTAPADAPETIDLADFGIATAVKDTVKAVIIETPTRDTIAPQNQKISEKYTNSKDAVSSARPKTDATTINISGNAVAKNDSTTVIALKIPASNPAPTPVSVVTNKVETSLSGVSLVRKKHVVLEDETLYGIAKKYKMKVARLLEINKLDGNTKIHFGDTIIVEE